jgi:hypothetical protein
LRIFRKNKLPGKRFFLKKEAKTFATGRWVGANDANSGCVGDGSSV